MKPFFTFIALLLSLSTIKAQDKAHQADGKVFNVTIVQVTKNDVYLIREGASKVIKVPIETFTEIEYGNKDFPLNRETQRIEIQKVVEVEGATKEQLYSSAREWFVNTFKSSKAVLQMEDSSDGKLIGKGYSESKLISWREYDIWFLVKIETKDSRFRITFTDIDYITEAKPSAYQERREYMLREFVLDERYNKNGTLNSINVNRYKEVKTLIDGLIQSAEKEMSKVATDDW